MKYSKRIIFIIFGIVLNLVSMDVSFFSERPPLAEIAVPILTPKPRRYNSYCQDLSLVSTLQSEQERVALKKKLLQKYSADDVEIIKYWTSAAMVRRIEDPKSSFIAPKNKIIESLVGLDVFMQNGKAGTKDMLFRSECHKVGQNSLLDSQQKEQLSAYMNTYKESIKNELWLAHMYDLKDAIHKEIEVHKGGTGCKESYDAWPCIREIAVIKGFVHSGK